MEGENNWKVNSDWGRGTVDVMLDNYFGFDSVEKSNP